MERKHSEQAPMSIGWYINEIKRLEEEVASWKGRMKAILGEDEPDIVGNRILSLQAEVTQLKEENGNMDSMYQDRMLDLEAKLHKHYDRLTALVQEHQTYQTKQGEK